MGIHFPTIESQWIIDGGPPDGKWCHQPKQGAAMPAGNQDSAASLALRVVVPFAAGYFLSYLYRTVNAVLAPAIGQSIALDAADIGLMTGVYFFTFACAQLPVGIALDRFGPRRVESTLLLFAASGALAFSLADGVPALVMGRALVGFGVSACLMASIKANVLFFPPQRLALMNGIILGAGGLGAVAATTPVQWALGMTDWRGVYGGVAALTLLSAAVLFLVVPEKPIQGSGASLASQIRDLGEIFTSAIFWRVAPATMISLGSFMAIQGLWAGPWLADVAGLDVAGTATGLSLMAGGMAVGYLSVGAMADRLERLGLAPIWLGWGGMAAHALCLAAMALGWIGAPMALAAAFGVTGAASSINYAVLTRRFDPRLSGRVTTSLNLLIFVAAFSLQWGMGWVLRLWDKVAGHAPMAAWQVTLGIPLALGVLTLAWQVPALRKRAGS
jgi:nitrate/nitrite transporter NarK